MKKLFFVMFVVVIAAGLAVAQNPTYTSGNGLTGIDVLGAHNNGGRGCAGCHAPHSGAAGGGGDAVTGTGAGTDTQSGSNALFGQDVAPLFGLSLTFADDGGAAYVEALPSQAAAYSTNTDELRGIMMCLACHDGVVAKGQMMTGKSWEQANNLLPTGIYGPHNIPTLLGNDSGNGNTSQYGNDHPVGTGATLGALRLVTTGNPATDPLKVTLTAGAITAIVPQSASYTAFATNYGYPAIAGSAWEWGFAMPNGGTDASKAFMTCTTCHNQHVMYIYKAPSGKQVGSAIAGGTYPTYFFVNGPYNPGSGNTPTKAASTTQFCRQCHTGESNEANGVNNVTTSF
jgi:hypothetical protein